MLLMLVLCYSNLLIIILLLNGSLCAVVDPTEFNLKAGTNSQSEF